MFYFDTLNYFKSSFLESQLKVDKVRILAEGQINPKETISSLLQLFRENKSGGYLCSDKFNDINKYIMSIFAGKTLMITGGTGSFGNAVLNRFLCTDIGEIRIFSRDEKKQDDMRHEYQVKYPDVVHKIKFFIGDVRNLQSCKNAMPGVDYIFHAAALKQVPSCEFFPMEAVKTNVIGTDNVLTAAIEAGVGAVICLSTDKAAYPINAMGITKAIEEKIAVAKSRYSGNTKICCTRYGNVMCSRGSVIPLWIDQIRNGNPITLTEPNMTRFIMSLEEAVNLVLFAFEHGQNGDILVQKAPACTIQTQAEAVCELFGGKKEDILSLIHI